MKNVDFLLPEDTSAEKIKALRKLLKLTQKDFSVFVGCSQSSVERWETSDKPISGPIALMVNVFTRHPELIEDYRLPEKKYPLRMIYMHEDNPCTLIDVDELQQKLEIRNYTNKVMFRAFGREEHPTFADYEEFLSSRCFPESRDKMKVILKELNLPFYDPLMIIEKTEGRMAEDQFWLKIMR